MGIDKELGNSITLSSYEVKLEEYIAGSPAELSAGLQRFIDAAFEDVELGSTVLELGAGFGRDASYLQSRGYKVIPTDAAKSFVYELQRRGLPAFELNVLTDDLPSVDVIFANAVFLHFTQEELHSILCKIRAALNPSGRLVFTVKKGVGEEWSTEKLGAVRYFVYWNFETLIPELIRAGFTAVDATEDSAGSTTWIQIVAS